MPIVWRFLPQFVISLLLFLFCLWYTPEISAKAKEEKPDAPRRFSRKEIAYVLIGMSTGYGIGLVARPWRSHIAAFGLWIWSLFLPYKETFVKDFLFAAPGIIAGAAFLQFARSYPRKHNKSIDWAVAILASGGSVAFHNWLTNDIVVLVLVAGILGPLQNWEMKSVIAASCLIMMWDIFFVFFSGTIPYVIEYAVGGLWGLLLIIPQTISLHSLPSSGLGCGDLFWSGLVIVVAYRTAGFKGFWCSFAGYCVGLAVCTTIGLIFRHAQPATIYLLPLAITGALLGIAWSRETPFQIPLGA